MSEGILLLLNDTVTQYIFYSNISFLPHIGKFLPSARTGVQYFYKCFEDINDYCTLVRSEVIPLAV